MKDHVTVIPIDKIVVVNGEALKFDFESPANIHAIQWHNGSGHIEFNDGTFNEMLTTEEQYNQHVEPYVLLWEEEKAKQPTPEPEPEPTPVTLEDSITTKLQEVMTAYASAFAPINAMYPAIEREGWAEQEAEAKAVLADPAVETPVLSILVQLRNQGETVAELAAKVLANAAQWRLVYAYLTGQQQRMYAEVSALDTVDAVLAYAVRYTMPEGY